MTTTHQPATTADAPDQFEVPVPETDAADAEEVERCPYCDRPFRVAQLRDLHVGEAHAEECTEEERAAYEVAYEAEADDLFMFHMKIVVALGLLFFLFVFSYMGVTIHL